MLSVVYPEMMRALDEAGPGIWPFKLLETGEYILAVKGSADLALAAKLRKEFKFHLYHLKVEEKKALGILTAFYDRQTAPIVVRTVCGDPLNREIVSAVRQSKIEVAFFDMHNSELFSGHWRLIPAGPIPSFLDDSVELESSDPDLLEFYVSLQNQFSNALDDGFVITAALVKSEHREDLTVIHLTEHGVSSRRSEGKGVYVSQLDITERPGDFHEAEIARALARIYQPSSVFVNPRTNSRPEFCDVLAIGFGEAICVQAKSTLRDEARALERDERRQLRATKHFKKSVKQVLGAERAFYHSGETIMFGSEPLGLSPNSHRLMHMVVIFEKHPSVLGEWSALVSELRRKRVFVVVLDTAEFQNLVGTYRTHDEFCRALFTIDESFENSGRIGEYVFHGRGLAAY